MEGNENSPDRPPDGSTGPGDGIKDTDRVAGRTDPSADAGQPSSQRFYADPSLQPRRPGGPPPALVVIVAVIATLVVVYVLTLLLKPGDPGPTTVPDEPETRQSQTIRESTPDVFSDLYQDEMQAVILNDDALQGEGKLVIEPGKALIDPGKDAALAAIADCFYRRIGAIHGIRQRTLKNATVETREGTWRRFFLSSRLSSDADGEGELRIRLRTPSRGEIVVRDGFLVSLKPLDYDGFIVEAERAGFSFQHESSPEDGTVRTRMLVGPDPTNPIPADEIISMSGVGPIQVGMPSERAKSLLEKRYSLLEKRVAGEQGFINLYKVENSAGQPLFYIYAKNGVINGVHLIGDQFKTARGVGLGNTLGQFRAHYPQVTLTSRPDKLTVLSVPDSQAKFILTGDDRLDFSRGVFPDDTLVGSVLIGTAPVLQ